MSVEALSGKVFLLITGASRGIGRQIAITFGSLLEKGSRMLLLARNKDALEEIAKNLSSKVKVCTISADSSKATKSDLKGFISESLQGTTCNAFDRLIVVHNVGTTGILPKVLNEMTDVNTWREYFDLNFFLPAVLNAVVMNIFNNKTIKKTVINMSSFLGVAATKYYGDYCSVKAAREMYFKVFALENPDVNVLSYDPGVVDTDMTTKIYETVADPEAKMLVTVMRENKTELSTEQTVNRLVQVLKEHKYNSGDRVEYCDTLIREAAMLAEKRNRERRQNI
jgi:sepiapterin reductase